MTDSVVKSSKMDGSIASSERRSRSKRDKKSKKGPKILIDENLLVGDEDNGIIEGSVDSTQRKKSSRKKSKKSKKSNRRGTDGSVEEGTSSLLIKSSVGSSGMRAKKGKGKRAQKMKSDLEETLSKIE